MTLSKLADYHARIAAAADRTEQIVRAGGDDAPARLNSSRMMMAQVMGSYQLFLHREIFEPVISSGTSAEIGYVKNLKVECVIFADELHSYMKSWNPADVLACWPSYRAAALAVLGRVRIHMRRVEREVAALSLSAAAAGECGSDVSCGTMAAMAGDTLQVIPVTAR
jgi:hypothetical protein